jgi:hypothetical protein
MSLLRFITILDSQIARLECAGKCNDYGSDSLCSLNDTSHRVAHARPDFQRRHRDQSIDRQQIRQAPALPARGCRRLYLQRFPTSRLGPQSVSCCSARSGHSERALSSSAASIPPSMLMRNLSCVSSSSSSDSAPFCTAMKAARSRLSLRTVNSCVPMVCLGTKQ